MAMDGSSSSDGNRRNNGKRPASKSFLEKLREPKRGVGIAKLEKMRMEEEMRKEKYLHDPFSSRPHISVPGIDIQGMMSYGPNGNMRGLFIVPLASRPPSPYGPAASNVNVNHPSYTEPTRTLQLFPERKGDEHADSRGEGDHRNLPVEEPAAWKNADADDNPQGLDLELRLWSYSP